jgi:5,10-methylenetetrahydromethanopterin reductase
MKFSLRLNNDHPVADYVKYARLAEAAGFDQFWVSNDLFLRSAPVILSAVALATTSI